MDLTFDVQTVSPGNPNLHVFLQTAILAVPLTAEGENEKSTYGDLILGYLMDSKDILNIHHLSFYEHLGNSLQR